LISASDPAAVFSQPGAKRVPGVEFVTGRFGELPGLDQLVHRRLAGPYQLIDLGDLVVDFLYPLGRYPGDLLQGAYPVVGGHDVQWRQDRLQHRADRLCPVPQARMVADVRGGFHGGGQVALVQLPSLAVYPGHGRGGRFHIRGEDGRT
jgi:hypothetical protein